MVDEIRVRSLGKKGHRIERDGESIGHCVSNPLKAGFRLDVYETEELESLLFEISMLNPMDDGNEFSIEEDGRTLGYLKRRKEKRLAPDKWWVMDDDDRELCCVEETSVFRSLMQEYVMGTLPVRYTVKTDGRDIGDLKREFSIGSESYTLRVGDSDIEEWLLISVPLCISNL